MYPLAPHKAYVHKRVDEQPHWRARVERVLDGCSRRPEVVRYDAESLPQVVEALREPLPPAEAGVPQGYTRALVFTVQELKETAEEMPDVSDLVARCGDESEAIVRRLLGHTPTVINHHPRCKDHETDLVCWPTYDFRTVHGCPHECQYCGAGKNGTYIALGVNLEEYVEKVVPEIVAKHSWQHCFRLLGDVAEQAVFEPEYGAFELFNEKLAELDRFLYFHSAGDNIDWAADLPHPDRLIGVFSVTCDYVARELEKGSGSYTARFDAMGRLNKLGIPVRPKFKPIIPVKNWRAENARAIEEMFARSRPESVGLCVIMWNTVDWLVENIGEAHLDPELLAAAREAAPVMKDVRTGPYPHAARKEIYRHFIAEIRKHDTEVPVYLSTESRQMWDELEGELGQDKRAFFCGCSPVGLPGRKLKLSEDCPCSTYVPAETAAPSAE